jgi:hypothetical protein
MCDRTSTLVIYSELSTRSTENYNNCAVTDTTIDEW